MTLYWICYICQFYILHSQICSLWKSVSGKFSNVSKHISSTMNLKYSLLRKNLNFEFLYFQGQSQWRNFHAYIFVQWVNISHNCKLLLETQFNFTQFKSCFYEMTIVDKYCVYNRNISNQTPILQRLYWLYWVYICEIILPMMEQLLYLNLDICMILYWILELPLI